MQTMVSGYELAPSQKRLWSLQQAGYVLANQVSIRIDGPVSVQALTQALQAIVNRHEAFRTRYQPQPTLRYPLQVVQENVSVSVEQTDLQMNTPAEQELYIETLFNGYLTASVSSADSMTWRANLLRLADNRHMLILPFPVLGSDARTMLNVIRELQQVYATSGSEDDEPFQFGQYADWQNELMHEENEEASTFWAQYSTERLGRHPLSLELPSDTPAAQLPNQIRATLSVEMTQRIRRVAHNANTTAAVIIQSCWSALLWGYSNFADELVSNHVASGRSYDEFAEINGLLAKTLPLRLAFSPSQTMSELWKQLTAESETLIGWQDYFDANPHKPNELGKTDPAYSTACFEHVPVDAQPGAVPTAFRVDRLYAYTDGFAVKLTLVDYSDELELQLYYWPTNWVTGGLEALWSQFRRLLDRVLEAPDSSLAELLSESTPDRLPCTDNTVAHMPAWNSLKDLLDGQVHTYPDQLAVADEERQLTYAELHAQANRLAHYLIHQYRVETGDVVALKMSRSVTMIVALLGIIKTGATYLPIDPQTPDDRLLFILNDSNAKLILTDEHAVTAVSPVPVVYLPDNTLPAYLNEQPDTAPAVLLTNRQPVYLIYTSGSTGKPKGVFIANESLLNYITWFQTTFQVSHHDRTLLLSSIAFDLGYTSLWTSLTSGCSLFLMPETTLLTPDQLQSALTRHAITYIKLTPSHFTLLANAPILDTHKSPYALRLVLLGGEDIRTEPIQKFRSVHPDVCFVNHYGPTETTIGVCTHTLIDDAALDQFARKPVIGSPIHNNRVYILNEENGLLPIGMTGELCVSGKGVALGYLNRDDTMREKFVPNPYEPSQTLYRTGDLGRWLPDGTIEFLGRKDNQVKVRGYRVELSEIELCLLALPAIDQVVVLLKDDKQNEKQLTAYFIGSSSLTTPDLRHYLGEHLPEYMIPAFFVRLAAFPLKPNGKINRDLLPDPAEAAIRSGSAYVPPRNAIEEQIVAIWQRILGIEQVGIYDNFFDLGGNSLKLVAMLGALAELFPGKIVLSDLFKYNTISTITGQLVELPQEEAIDILEV